MTVCLLRLLPVVAALFQLVGTALILYALVVGPSETASNVEIVSMNPFTFGREYPHSVIKRHRPRLFKLGAIRLLAGLALQVVVVLIA